MAKYKVRWKGKELGAFTRDEITLQLRLAKMSLLHQVFAGENWLSLKDFLDNYEEQAPRQVLKENFLSFAYFSTGLCFLSPYLLLLPLIFIIYYFKNNFRKSAVIILVLSISMTLLGLCFFNFVANYIS